MTSLHVIWDLGPPPNQKSWLRLRTVDQRFVKGRMVHPRVHENFARVNQLRGVNQQRQKMPESNDLFITKIEKTVQFNFSTGFRIVANQLFLLAPKMCQI